MNTNVRLAPGTGTVIDKKIFGSFIEHIEHCILNGICDPGHPLSDEKGIRQDVLEKCRELSPPILRFPGGTVIGIYHWEDHIGPVENRKKMRNLIWGERLCHEFGTAEYVQYCRDIGAEPMICVNMPTGSAEEAAHWVEYCNGTADTYYANLRRRDGYEEPFNVKYWCIGNESSAEPDLGWQHDVQIYIREAWEFTKYMKLTDPTIKLVFVGGNDEWNRAVLDSLYPVCDYFSLHFYSRQPDYGSIVRFENGILAKTEALLAEYNEKEFTFNKWYRFPPRTEPIRIALDEWNIWDHIPTEKSPHGLGQSYTWECALWVAKTLHMMIRHAETVGIGNMAQMVNVIAPIKADEHGSWRQTIFYPMRDYPKACGTYLAEAQYDCPNLDLCATRHEDGSYTVFAVNTSSEEITAAFETKVQSHAILRSGDPKKASSAGEDIVCQQMLTPDSAEVTLPPYSISILRI